MHINLIKSPILNGVGSGSDTESVSGTGSPPKVHHFRLLVPISIKSTDYFCSPAHHTHTHTDKPHWSPNLHHGRIKTGKIKVMPYSILNVVSRADPSVDAVSAQLTLIINPTLGCNYFLGQTAFPNIKSYPLITWIRGGQLTQSRYVIVIIGVVWNLMSQSTIKKHIPVSSDFCRFAAISSSVLADFLFAFISLLLQPTWTGLPYTKY